MGTGWRKALCTTIQRDSELSSPEDPRSRLSPKTDGKFSFFRRSRSSPSTPRYQHRTQSQLSTPNLRIRTGPPASHTREDTFHRTDARIQAEAATPRSGLRRLKLPFLSSNPPSPRSPSRLALLLKNHLRPTRNKCGICLQTVKAVKGAAIFTTECSHAFHLECIAGNFLRQPESCPLCTSPWRRSLLLYPSCSEDKQHQQCPGNSEGEKSLSSLRRKSSTVGVYLFDDDEPLLVNARTNFHTIPEAEDENCEAGEQPGKDMRVIASSDAAPLSTGRVHESHVVALKIKMPVPSFYPPAAPLLDPSLRAPVDLVTVLYTEARLQVLRRAMRVLLSCLGPRDRLSIVATAKRLLPLRRMTPDGQRAVRRVLERHVSDSVEGVCSSAAQEECLRKAAKVLEDRRESNPVAAVLLLGEDQDGGGPQSLPSHKGEGFALVRVPLSREPDEQQHYLTFASLAGGRLSVVCQSVRLELSFPAGEVRSVYDRSGSRHMAVGSAGGFGMGDMHAGEERELLVEVKLGKSSNGGALLPLVVRCSYRDPATHKLVQRGGHSLPVFFSRGGDSVVAPKVVLLRRAFIAARAVMEARRLADVGDYGTGLHLLFSARRLLLQRNSISPDENLRAIDRELEELQGRRRKAKDRQTVPSSLDNYSPAAEALTPMSAWRAAERLAKVAIMRKSLNRVSDLHGFENARF